ncbi:THO complex subunit 7 homolog [Acanthaster planci]|uniref:THO complex subunit 7 homolog n=1 Tax=Acanthaster planci TaxID=133434 RepID=A0A8B7XR85_ACAPL|nr:THO complex subunit 7 homolog [Acanthaster planci]
MATDDEVIRRRLLIEGESGGDDRRINTLLRMFIKWCNSDTSEEESVATYQKMLSILAQVEFAMEKTQLIHDMNTKELTNYEELYSEIEQSIKEAHSKISACKLQVQDAKRVRKNRQEYDALAKVIKLQPDRRESMKKLEELDKELSNLKCSKQTLEQKLEDRRKQFHVLISSIQELQRILEEDDKGKEVHMETTLDRSMDTSMGDK